MHAAEDDVEGAAVVLAEELGVEGREAGAEEGGAERGAGVVQVREVG